MICEYANPMPMRVGIDLVSVKDVRESMREHGEHYLRRVYTERELRDCQTAGHLDPQRLAARFAAKEATLKVLRPDQEAIPWQTIEVVRNPAGWVELSLTGSAAALARAAGLDEISLSISHEGDFATAVVYALRTPSRDPGASTGTPSGSSESDR
jgi:holo-[acyl-carrier protein] synthase